MINHGHSHNFGLAASRLTRANSEAQAVEPPGQQTPKPGFPSARPSDPWRLQLLLAPDSRTTPAAAAATETATATSTTEAGNQLI